jgi:hypothetical protein
MFLFILLMLPQSFVVCDAMHWEIWHKLLAYIFHFQLVSTVNYRVRPPASVYSTAFTCPQGKIMRSKSVKYRRSLRICREFRFKKIMRIGLVSLQFWFKGPFQLVFRHLRAQKIMLISFLYSNYTTIKKFMPNIFFWNYFKIYEKVVRKKNIFLD